MDLSVLESLIMGLVSGLAQVFPVSAEAHRMMLQTFLGMESAPAVLSLFIHIGSLISLQLYFRNELYHLRKAGRLMRISPKRRKQPLDPGAANTVRLLRSAAMVMAVCRLLLAPLAGTGGQKLHLLTGALLFNGYLLLLPQLSRSGDMNSRNMPRIHGALMGFGAGIAGFAGISQTGASMSLGQWQGVDRKYAWRFAGILLIPGIACRILMDIAAIIAGGAGISGVGILFALLGGVGAAVGSWLAARIMSNLAEQKGFSFFAYYSWGMALLCFILFLMIY